jgi:hypothetical protein
MNKKAWVYAFSVLSMLALGPATAAEVDGLPWERGAISVGGFLTDLNTELRLDSDTGLGTVVNVENLLGLQDTSNVFRMDAFYRIRPKHRVDFTYYDLTRSSTSQIQGQIDLPNQVIPIDTVVESNFDIRFLKGGYSYSFLQDDRMDLGLSVGVYVAQVDIGIRATNTNVETQQDVTAPLPVFGLRGDFAITPKLFYKNSLEFFYLKIGDYTGSVIDLNMKLEYNLFKHLGLGVGYNFLGVKIENDDSTLADFAGNLELDYSGLQLYGKLYF